MRRFTMTLVMLGVVLLLTGCASDDSGTFVLGECRLDAAECRLQ